MNTLLRCVAPQCDRGTDHGKVHCRLHSKEFHSIYNKYKKAQRCIEHYIDCPKKLESLVPERLLCVLNKLFLVIALRRSYRDRAYREEYHDRGHEDFIRKLIVLSRSIEDTLTRKFTEPVKEVSEVEDDNSLEEEDNEGSLLKGTQYKVLLDLRASRLELESEFHRLMGLKSTIINSIYEEFNSFLKKINEKLGSHPLSMKDRETRLLYKSSELIEDAMMRGHGMGICGDTLHTFDITSSIHNPFIVINWEHIPTMELLVESIYNGKLKKRDFQDDSNTLDALVMLIDASRLQTGNCVFRYVLDDGLKIEIKPHKSRCYPQKYQIKTLQ